MSERFLRVDVHGCTNVASAWSARATWRSMKPDQFKWEPQFLFWGKAVVAALFGYFVGLQQKSNSP